mgnify:CR=1 FL=1
MQDISDWLKEKQITEVECLIPDITGNARGKFIPADKFVKEDSRLPESILIQTVTGEYTDAHDSLVSPLDADMFLVPDASTMKSVPWAEDPTAQIIHDCHTRDGSPHPLSTRNILKRVLKLYEDEGWQPVVAPEVEFYLVQQNIDPNCVLQPPKGRSGRPETARQSYSIDALNEFEPFIEEMYDFCEDQGLDVDTLIHESGAAQMEINFLHGDALSLADQVFTFKRTVRETAYRQGIYATFMAKPMEIEPGSAMHIHQSIIDKETGKNIFVNDKGEENDRFRHYIGGLQKFTPAAISFYAPNVNSYRRFAKDMSAPVNLEWGYDNRTAGIRVPDSSAQAKRVENRFPGVDANPYLAFAATLGCGYLGMKHGIEPSTPNPGDAATGDIDIARNLEHALSLLNSCPELEEIFGDVFIKAYSAVKEEEFEAFNRVISSWEREFLLLNV